MTVHLPFPLLDKIVGLQQISSFFVGIRLPCLMLRLTSLPRVVTQQTAFLECWGDFLSLCWDWNNGKSPCQTFPTIGLKLKEGKSDTPTIGWKVTPTTIFPKSHHFVERIIPPQFLPTCQYGLCFGYLVSGPPPLRSHKGQVTFKGPLGSP